MRSTLGVPTTEAGLKMLAKVRAILARASAGWCEL
jgi:hypothetical protein